MVGTVEETLQLGAAALGVEALTADGAPFPGSNRTVVVRGFADSRSVIVKRYLDPCAQARHREPAGLAVMGGDGVPRLLADHPEEPVIVMEDLGDGPHLASRLLGTDPAAAAAALVDWATALGRFHATGLTRVADFERELHRRDPALPVDQLPEQLAESAAAWPALCDRLGVDPGPFEVLTDVPGRWRTDTRAISPNDTCPDNCIETPAGTVLLDLEGADVRHVAMDAAYLLVPFPTCWCAWGLPPALAESALRAWAAAAGLPLGDDLRADVELATITWHWVTAGWFLPALFTAPVPMPEGKPTPERADRLVRSLTAAARSDAFPELRRTATALVDAITTRWPAAPVLDAPALR